MISAWVFFYSHHNDRYHFEHRDGTRFDSKDPKDWGLPEDCIVLLVLQRASIIAAWIEGKPAKLS